MGDDSEAPRRKSSSATKRDGKRKVHDIDKSNELHKDKRGRDSSRKSKVVDSSREDSNSPRKSKKKVKKRDESSENESLASDQEVSSKRDSKRRIDDECRSATSKRAKIERDDR